MISNKNIKNLVALSFLCISLALVTHHEMWRDELQAWLLSRDSNSLGELFRNLKYEGHPGLWHTILYLFSRLNAAPIVMQYFHVLIASTTAFVIATWSPFSAFQRLMLIFGYFFFYEYSLISRNYAIGILFIFIICALYPRRKIYPITIATMLLLLSHTSIFGLIFSLCLFLTIYFEEFLSKAENRVHPRFSNTYFIAIVIVITGFVSAIIQLIPPSDSGFANAWRFYPSLDGIKSIYKAFIGSYFPIPNLTLAFWNSNLFLSSNFFGIVGPILIIGTIYLFLRYLATRPSALFFYISSSIACSLFFYTKYSGYLRHHGFLFIALVAALWIYSHSKENYFFPLLKKFKLVNKNNVNNLITALFAVHLGAALIAISYDLGNQFSGAKKTAEYIKSEGLVNAHIIGYPAYATSPVAGYLLSKELFYVEAKRYGTFVKWDQANNKDVNQKSLCDAARNLSLDGSKVILIVNKEIAQNFEGACFQKIYDSEVAIVSDERLFIYRFLSETSH